MRKAIVFLLLAGSFVALAIAGGRGFPALAQTIGGASRNGDCNGDGARDLSDAVRLLSWLFQGAPEPVPMLCPAPAYCDLIYDEFTSLMNKEFLLRPQNYVQTVSGKLSRLDYNNRQKGIFVSSEATAGWGIARVHTNGGSFGKFLFKWDPPSGGTPSLIIKDATIYGRVIDGYLPRTLPLLTVPSSYTVDLDTGTLNAGAASDVWFNNIDGNTMYIEAVKGATLDFPMESLCR